MKRFWEAFKREWKKNGVKTSIETAKEFGPYIVFGSLYGFLLGKSSLGPIAIIISCVVVTLVFNLGLKAVIKKDKTDES